jgi:hypothetical protein
VVELYGTDPKSRPDDYSRIISPKATERLAGLIDQNKVVIGGTSDPEACYLDPTVIHPVTWDDPIMEDEIFGPLLPVLTYKDMDAAIREVKKHPKPLSGFLFSRDQKTIDHFLASLSFGGGAINQVNIHLFIETMPFGGSDIPALVTTTARPGLTPSRMRNRFSFRRPTWPSSTCSRRIRRKRSTRSASGLSINTNARAVRRTGRKFIHECGSRSSRSRLLDHGNRDCPLYPSGIPREAS